MNMRPLGKTGVTVPPVALGGIVAAGMNRAEADSLVGEALDAGITYVDAAPTYGDCEEVLGPVLEGHRNELFLACKTTERTKDGARKELERSLTRLRTDHFDLYQAHALNSVEDAETFLGPGGALETFVAAREEGKTRFLGITAHSEEAALLVMDRFAFDTVLFPFNFACWMKNGFGPRVMERAKERGMGVLGLKAMARQMWPEGADRTGYAKCWYEPLTDPEMVALGLRFAWGQGVTTCMPPGEPELWRMAVKAAAKGQEPLTAEEMERLKSEAEDLVPVFPH